MSWWSLKRLIRHRSATWCCVNKIFFDKHILAYNPSVCARAARGQRDCLFLYAFSVSYIQYNGIFSVSHCNEKTAAFLRKKFASSMLNVSHCSEEESCYQYIQYVHGVVWLRWIYHYIFLSLRIVMCKTTRKWAVTL